MHTHTLLVALEGQKQVQACHRCTGDVFTLNSHHVMDSLTRACSSKTSEGPRAHLVEEANRFGVAPVFTAHTKFYVRACRPPALNSSLHLLR